MTEPAPEVLPIVEAAQRLNTTVDAVRKRILREKLRGYKIGAAWFVVMPGNLDSAEHIARRATSQPTGQRRDSPDNIENAARQSTSQSDEPSSQRLDSASA